MAINRNALTQNAEELDANGMPLNAIRNNLTGMMTRLQSGPSSGVSLDYSRPMIQLANGKKGYYGKDDPSSVYDAEGNKLSTLIADVSAHNAAQDRAYQLQKQQMDLETGRLHQQRMQQELTQGRSAPPGYRFTQDGNMEPIPGGPADLKSQGIAQQKAAGATDVDMAVGTLRDAYDRLQKGGGITSTANNPLENLAAAASSSGVGQMVGKALGTQNQSARNDIAMTRPALLAALMKATGMSAKQMDSNAELKLWMTTATDPTLDVEANRRALAKIEQKYIGGGVQPAQSQLGGVPSTGAVVNGYKFLGGNPADQSRWMKVQ